MKITDRLIGDHKTFRKMAQEIDDISNLPPAKRDHQQLRRIVELFKDHLILHAWFEDNFYYPDVSAAIAKNPNAPLSAAYMSHLDHEHKTIDGYADQLERDVKSVPIVHTWPQTFALFFHGLKSHMKREEEELFPVSEEMLGSKRLEELSVEMEKRRSEAPRIRHHTPSR